MILGKRIYINFEKHWNITYSFHTFSQKNHKSLNYHYLFQQNLRSSQLFNEALKMKRRASFCFKTCVWKYKSKKYYCWHSFTVATHLPWLFPVKICGGYLPQLFAVGICRNYLPWEFAVRICRGYLPWEFAVRICCGYLPRDFCICKQILFGICKQILFIWLEANLF